MRDRPVGFGGSGAMGRPMAGHVAKAGAGLWVCDIDAAAAAAVAAETGARVAGSPREVAEAAAIVITMLPTGADVRAVALGPDGLADGFGADGVLIDMSSSEPTATVALAAELAARGIAMIDAPVSGGRAKAVDGTLTLMVGGDDTTIDRCLPVLQAMGEQIFRTGGAGTGHALKALNNLMSAAGMLIGAEALAIGKRFGLDPGIMLDAINASTGMNHSTKAKFRQRVLSRSFDTGFALDLMIKDLDIALALARETRTPVPFSAQCREMWATALLNLGPGQDHSDLVRWIERTAQTELVGKAGGEEGGEDGAESGR